MLRHKGAISFRDFGLVTRNAKQATESSSYCVVSKNIYENIHKCVKNPKSSFGTSPDQGIIRPVRACLVYHTQMCMAGRLTKHKCFFLCCCIRSALIGINNRLIACNCNYINIPGHINNIDNLQLFSYVFLLLKNQTNICIQWI